MRKSTVDLEKIRDLHRSGQLDQAKEGYLSVLRKNPHDVDALHWLGVLNAQQKNYHEAAHHLQQAIELAPGDLSLKLHLANTLKLQGQYNQSAQLLLKLIEQHPSYLPAKHNLGIVYYAQGKLSEAEKIFRQVIVLEPNYIDAAYNLGLTLAKQNRYEDAIIVYEQLLKLSTEHFAAHFHLACAKMQTDKISEAIEQFHIVEKNQPHHFETQCNLATCYLKQNKLSEAKIHYVKALEIEERDTQILFNLGVISTQQGNFDQAIQYYQKAIQINPDYFDAQNNLGVAFLAKQHSAFALRHFQEASRLQPKNESIAYAVKMLEKNKDLSIASPEYIKTLFDAYADHYEAHLMTALEYQIPKLLRQAILDCTPLAPASKDILDLGCGTGLCGIAFKPFAKSLTGIDLSDKMLAVAKDKNIYDALSVSELTAFLTDKSAAYDLILAGDVLVYLGELDSIFGHISHSLRPHGIFAFNTEISHDSDYQINQSGRFAHSKRYLERLAQQHGFIILSYQQVVTRLQNNEPVDGHLYVLQLTTLSR